MKTKLIKFFNLIKKDKQAKILTIIGTILLFIFTLGYSLSMFTTSQNNKVANIKVNDLTFNITTNSGESNDRILHLQAGKIEQFNIILTNLNKIDAKYEFTYELCNNQNCTETSKSIPSDISVSKEDESSEVSGTINTSKTKSLTILTNNKSNNDYYIKLNLNAGYIWNDLELANQIINVYKYNFVEVISYVDGIKVKAYPDDCNYKANIKGYIGNNEIQLEDASVNCNFTTKKWRVSYGGYVEKIVIDFTPGIFPGSFADDSWDKIAEVVKNGQGQAYPVGSEKIISVGNSPYKVRVSNNSTPSICSTPGFSQTACGFVVEFVDVVEKRAMNSPASNVGGWPSSALRRYANGDFYNKLSVDLRNVITDTYVVSSHGSYDKNNNRTDGNWESKDKIFLLSRKEIHNLNSKDTSANSTRQLDYYNNKGVTETKYSDALKKYNSSDTSWWTRSAQSDHRYGFLAVAGGGGAGAGSSQDDSVGLSPAFRIG